MSLAPLKGLVICGGRSSRMGHEKFLLEYHGLPQYLFLKKLMENFSDDIYFSFRRGQEIPGLNESQVIYDTDEYTGYGPISGVLSAFEKLPSNSLLVIAVDYPFLTANDIGRLVQSREEGIDALCFHGKETAEPLICLYENSSYKKLKKFFHEDQYSLRHFLGVVNTKMLNADDISHLQSIDTHADYLEAKRKLEGI
jgi:molybdopterin-guanine dinucleotide biosynthesis protein A